MILKGYCTSIKSDIILFYPLDSDLEDFVTSMNMFIYTSRQTEGDIKHTT